MRPGFKEYGRHTQNHGERENDPKKGDIRLFTHKETYETLKAAGRIEEASEAEYQEQQDAQRPIISTKYALTTKRDIIPDACDYLLGKTKFLFDTRYSRYWRYDTDAGIWREDGEAYINSIIRREIAGEDVQRCFVVNELSSRIKGLQSTPEGLPEAPPHLISFKNGVYDLRERTFKVASPDMYLTYRLPVNLPSEETGCDRITDFFSEIVSKEDGQRLLEWSAYCLFPRYSYQKFLLLYGAGCNGKGTFLRLLLSVIGRENAAAESLQALAEKDFSVGGLCGKLVNISGDLSAMPLKDSAMIKKLTGGDLVMCNRKHRQSFPFTNAARLIFSANEPPRTTDKSRAFFRRVDLIEFPNDFTGRERRNLDAELQAPDQVEGFAFYLIGELQRLFDNGFQLTNPRTLEETADQYEKLSNPVLAAVYAGYERDPSSYVSTSDIYLWVDSYTKKSGGRKKSATEIKKSLLADGVEDDRKDNRHVFYGLRRRSIAEEPQKPIDVPSLPGLPTFSGYSLTRIGSNAKMPAKSANPAEILSSRQIIATAESYSREHEKGEGVDVAGIASSPPPKFALLRDVEELIGSKGIERMTLYAALFPRTTAEIDSVLDELKRLGRIFEINCFLQLADVPEVRP
jgi:P4 family phage/plasmid primase-like protien